MDSESEAESMVTVGSEPEEEQVKEKEKVKGGEGGSAKRAGRMVGERSRRKEAEARS